MNLQTINDVASELFDSLKQQKIIQPLTDRYPEIDIKDAYQISRQFLSLREAVGEKVIGKKIGVTSSVVQEMLGVDQPDFGFLTDAMRVQNRSTFSIEDSLIQPRAEAEIAFILKEDLFGPGVSKEDVIAATDKILPCFEIVDSRIENWNIKIQDTVADNASCGIFILGEGHCSPEKFSMEELSVEVTKNGKFLSAGQGSAVQGHPAQAVAWLANTLGEYDIPLLKGEVILSGSLVPLEPAKAGDKFSMELKGVGTCEINFI
ncbi:fumarylacetoacetate hydrolase family protein [Gammaproteobacteria bacterium]|jgi:2-oxopent-4-enoate/cis-2-oxohex-4-enoate hydratase|nr:fumarylacetoacetate hydrolase family protein [Gammaproteobacteria bacterium]MDB9859640.1 fumarylacetoacetate hydrolase family protein [Gammaproteobacteria bacterium]MDB9935197.1 fumarylacetoacetate hydrolase family protein [Gammaproteobacteria bacterium]MDB9939767.1 fumarylacetoacetate hydrolase family protein [Gammaproteobacteria bacterium]